MITRGFYRHYKGPVYFVTGVGQLHDSSRRIVIYESTQSVQDGVTRLRAEDDFETWVCPIDGSSALNHLTDAEMRESGFVRRFERVP